MYFRFNFCKEFESLQVTPIEKPFNLLGYELFQITESDNIYWKTSNVDDLTIIHGFIEAENEFEAVTDIDFFTKKLEQ